MKRPLHFLFLLMLLWPMFSVGQFTISNNEFPVPGLKIGKGFGIGATTILGSPGGPQFYDLSGVIPLYHDSLIYYDAALTPWAGQHPGAQMCWVEPIEDIIWIWYCTSTANTFQTTGVTAIGDFGQGLDTVHGNYTDADTLLSTDYTYGHGETENAVAIVPGVFPFADYKITKRKIVVADAWGDMVTPLNYYDEVLRVKVQEIRTDTLFYFGSNIYSFIDTLYYINFYAQGQRHPVIVAHTNATWDLEYFEFTFTPPVIIGCTDPMAQNYNPLANESDGSCTYCNISFAISNDTTVCQGSPVTLSVSGGTSWLWSNGATASSITVSPSQSTVYSVYVSDGPDCHAPGAVTVVVDEPVTAAFWTTHQIYYTGTDIPFVNLSEKANWFEWDFDDSVDGTSTLEFPSHTYNTPGEKLVVLIAGNSCFADTTFDTLIILSGVGVEEAVLPVSMKIWPNPGNDRVYLTTDVAASDINEIAVVDALGRRTVMTRPMDASTTDPIELNMEGYPPGWYLIEVTTTNGIGHIKWIKI